MPDAVMEPVGQLLVVDERGTECLGNGPRLTLMQLPPIGIGGSPGVRAPGGRRRQSWLAEALWSVDDCDQLPIEPRKSKRRSERDGGLVLQSNSNLQRASELAPLDRGSSIGGLLPSRRHASHRLTSTDRVYRKERSQPRGQGWPHADVRVGRCRRGLSSCVRERRAVLVGPRRCRRNGALSRT